MFQRAENLGLSLVMSVSLFLHGFGLPVLPRDTSQSMELFYRKVVLVVRVEVGLERG